MNKQDQRRSAGPSASRFRQGRQRDRGQCLGHQRRRRRGGRHDREESRGPGPEAAGADRRVRHQRAGPRHHGHGPGAGLRKALERAGWKAADVDLFEINEAFAAQACAVNKKMGRSMPSKVNVNGGAIAIGHPIGASGCRILVTLLYEMQRRDAKKGLATLCIGGGMGVSLAVER